MFDKARDEFFKGTKTRQDVRMPGPEAPKYWHVLRQAWLTLDEAEYLKIAERSRAWPD